MNHQASEAGRLTMTAPGVMREPRAFAGFEDWLEHGFGTRHVKEWPPGGRYASLRQIHSDRVVTVTDAAAAVSAAAQPDPDLEQGDALVTALPGVWIGIRTADCVPVLIADPVRRAVAAVHSGWRGTMAGIALKAVERLAAEYGSSAADLRVAVGPAIGACCYEVGPEVAEAFGARGVVARPPGASRPHLDLTATLERQLLDAGVLAGHLSLSRDCTRCDPAGRFHSYRRDGGAAGRMIAAIRIRPSPNPPKTERA